MFFFQEKNYKAKLSTNLIWKKLKLTKTILEKKTKKKEKKSYEKTL
jgi:hypothetical protein